MIYVEEKNFSRQIDLLNFLAASQELNLCAWLYPESNIDVLCGHEVTENPLSLTPVTSYGSGFSPKCTAIAQASTHNINLFGLSCNDVKKNCDSLALYKSNELAWFAAAIGHEGLCLIQDDSMLSSLTKAGFSASYEVPGWW